jgi:hypothetical protein
MCMVIRITLTSLLGVAHFVLVKAQLATLQIWKARHLEAANG